MAKPSTQSISEIVESAVTRAIAGVRVRIEREIAAATAEARSRPAPRRRGAAKPLKSAR